MTTYDVGSEVLYRGQRMRVTDPEFQGVMMLTALHDPAVVCRANAQEVSIAPALAGRVNSIDMLEWNGLQRLANAARNIMVATTTQERKARYELHALELGVSKRTLERAIKRLRQFNAVSALQPGKSGRPAGIRLLDRAVEEIIAHQLNECWLVKNKPNLSDVIEQIQSTCRQRGLSEPCASAIRKRVEALDTRRVTVLREGSKKAKYKHDAMVGHIDASRALETVQIDHTLADAILVSEDDRTVAIGRPWVTLAIDVASRMVVGVYVSFEAPSAISVAMCLVNALLPKEAFLASLGLQGQWPVFGVMETIHMDNGRDFHSEALQRGCSQLGIDIQYRPVGSPHYGGIIERLIGTFMGKCRLLPGATQSNVVKRADYDSESNAALTLREFVTFLVNEIVSVYHAKVHRTLEMAPLQKWKALEKEVSVSEALPAGWEHWMLPTTFYPYEMRLIRRTGIQMFHREFWAEGLNEWVGDKIPREVSYDPSDISKVFIIGPAGNVLVAHDTCKDARQISLAEMRWLRKLGHVEYESSGLLEVLDGGLETRQQLITNAIQATKGARKQSAIKKLHKDRGISIPPAIESCEVPVTIEGEFIDFSLPVPTFGVHRGDM
ncbi:Mu transposase C-terminal domain-containing protein [Dyella acidiphila]|uniref:Transposase n=1 Tax=Dyella acidiphila TaxID=2775866 RepID=A0ABR9GG42_9GAMM|nr:DDE-type integrase/transposase/recombinase [Dyella acidiphila]MBE1162997.1 transposase [Dyella acidiphila]